MKQNLEQIKTKIYELVPRLKELSFGCEVDIDYLVWRNSEIEPKKTRVIDAFDNQVYVDNVDKIACITKDDFQIIGHPIRLEDVLEAMTESDRLPENKWKQGIKSLVEMSEGWVFGKTLDDQSQETITLVGNLLDV